MELLPCPFCGSKSYIEICRNSNEDTIYTTTCTRCSCRLGGSHDKEDIINHWNNRASPWISVKKGLPDNCHTIIATDDTGLVVPCFYNIKEDKWMFWTGYKYMDLKIFEPTHWMPLPTPPKETK